jgi:general secretion pathway protein B
MSFILDALKKSESERNRKSGPVLMDMRIARPRRRLPVWVWIIAAVLLANLLLLGYVLFRGPAPQQAAVTPGQDATAPAAPAAAGASTPQPAPLVIGPGAPGALPSPTLPAMQPPSAGGVIRQSNELVSPTSSDSSQGVNTPLSAQPSAISSAQDEDIPGDEDLRATGVTLPQLRLNLHVYDANPANRFVLLNSARLGEGQESPDGVRVERIGPDSVILSWHGRRFRMHPGN